MPDEPTVAEIKARMAEAGLDFDLKNDYFAYDKPADGSRIQLIALDRVEDVERPIYRVTGFASCVKCDKFCYLGVESGKALAEGDGQLLPMCIACAEPMTQQSGAEKIGEIEDR